MTFYSFSHSSVSNFYSITNLHVSPYIETHSDAWCMVTFLKNEWVVFYIQCIYIYILEHSIHTQCSCMFIVPAVKIGLIKDSIVLLFASQSFRTFQFFLFWFLLNLSQHHCLSVISVWRTSIPLDGEPEVRRELQPTQGSDWEACGVMRQLTEDRPTDGLPQWVLCSSSTTGIEAHLCFMFLLTNDKLVLVAVIYLMWTQQLACSRWYTSCPVG